MTDRVLRSFIKLGGTTPSEDKDKPSKKVAKSTVEKASKSKIPEPDKADKPTPSTSKLPVALSKPVVDATTTKSNLENTKLESEPKTNLKLELYSEMTKESSVAKMPDMAWQKLALQMIPEFTGDPNELEAFLYQVDQQAARIPAGQSTQCVIDIVLGKLRGDAVRSHNRVKADNWREMRENIKKEFGGCYRLESVAQQIEELEQGPTESFISYRNRVLHLLRLMEEYAKTTNEVYPMRIFRSHVTSGLRDPALKAAARLQKRLEIRPLLEFLEEEDRDLEQELSEERRRAKMRQARAASPKKPAAPQNQYQKQPKGYNDRNDVNYSYQGPRQNQIGWKGQPQNQQYRQNYVVNRPNNHQMRNNFAYQDNQRYAQGYPE
ncbi:uncharacterized protein LOC118461241 [Anopheles albimanus]|uniref:uncharacterized protein LOC118461241 n=1 Tax=Anopheles albimanus TaxID=7167 RepID=UPI00163F5CC4|nr:uncharacterized protein LOC118461241 [Anopheles albimanus]